MVNNDHELAMKIAEKEPAERWIGLVQSFASGGGLHHTGTGSRVSTCYQLLLRERNKGKRANRVPVPGMDPAPVPASCPTGQW